MPKPLTAKQLEYLQKILTVTIWDYDEDWIEEMGVYKQAYIPLEIVYGIIKVLKEN